MSGTILFVDDDKGVLSSLDGLFADCGMNIFSTTCSAEALALVEQQEIAVIITESRVTDMTGLELLERVRDISPDTLRILLTSHADLINAVDAINQGFVFRFIVKPWDRRTLRQIVQDAVSRYQLIKTLKREDEESLLSAAQAIELKDPLTAGHCERVAYYALTMGRALQLSPEQMKDLKKGSWLHDCGKISVSRKVLNKTGQLTDHEYDLIRNHPRWGADLAYQAGLAPPVINIILRHHERFDGSGYPSGLAADDIPVEARIVTIADVFDALTTDRPYRMKFDSDRAVEIMRIMQGSVFDPRLLEVFLTQCMNSGAQGLPGRCTTDAP